MHGSDKVLQISMSSQHASHFNLTKTSGRKHYRNRWIRELYYLQVSLSNNENKSIIENSRVSYWHDKSIINLHLVFNNFPRQSLRWYEYEYRKIKFIILWKKLIEIENWKETNTPDCDYIPKSKKLYLYILYISTLKNSRLFCSLTMTR